MTTKSDNLKDTLKKLKTIIDDLEDSDVVDVEKGLEKVKEGAKLVKQARNRFDELENEFTDIKEDLQKPDESDQA